MSGNPAKITSTISGVIIDSRYQNIKNNYITIYKVDDGTHQINISFFEDKYTKYKNILVEDEILFLMERYRDDRLQLTMRADSVFPISTARQKYAKSINIIIPKDEISKDKILEIKKILDKNQVKRLLI